MFKSNLTGPLITSTIPSAYGLRQYRVVVFSRAGMVTLLLVRQTSESESWHPRRLETDGCGKVVNGMIKLIDASMGGAAVVKGEGQFNGTANTFNISGTNRNDRFRSTVLILAC